VSPAVETTLRFARNFSRAYEKFDAGAAASLWAEDGLERLMGSAGVRGRVAIERDLAKSFRGWRTAKMDIGRVWVNSAVSAVEFRFSGIRSAAPVNGAPVGESPVGLVGAMVLSFDERGYVTTEYEYVDTVTNLGQVTPGLLPPDTPFRPATTALPAGALVVETAATDEEERNLKAADEVLAAMNTRSVERVMAGMSSSFVWDDQTAPGPRDREATARALAQHFADIPDASVTSSRFAGGDDVVTETVTRGTFRGGPAVTLHAFHVFRFERGRVRAMWTYANRLELMTQIGAMKTRWM
jgi:hypothetical protein